MLHIESYSSQDEWCVNQVAIAERGRGGCTVVFATPQLLPLIRTTALSLLLPCVQPAESQPGATAFQVCAGHTAAPLPKELP